MWGHINLQVHAGLRDFKAFMSDTCRIPAASGNAAAFKHLDAYGFVIWSVDGGHPIKDSIGIRDGSLSYRSTIDKWDALLKKHPELHDPDLFSQFNCEC